MNYRYLIKIVFLNGEIKRLGAGDLDELINYVNMFSEHMPHETQLPFIERIVCVDTDTINVGFAEFSKSDRDNERILLDFVFMLDENFRG